MQSLLNSVGLGGLVPSPVNVPAAPALNLRNNARNNARNNGVRRRLNLNAQHPPGNEPEMVEENITVSEPMAMNVEAVEVMSPPGNEPTVGGRRRKAAKRSRKASRKAARKAASRKAASRKAASRKAARKASRKAASRKANRRN